MTTNELAHILIPLAKTSIWDQSNPLIDLRRYPHATGKPNKSTITAVYTLNRQFLGLGFFDANKQTLAFLHQQHQTIEALLEESLTSVFRKSAHNSAWHDLITPGFSLFKYDDVFVIRTFNSLADALIHPVANHLSQNHGARCVFLKNHTKARQKQNLTLDDGIITGSLPAPSITINEELFSYVYHIEDTPHVFPTQQKKLREHINTLIATQPECSIVIFNNEPSFWIATSNSLKCNCQNSSWESLALSEINTTMREQPLTDILLLPFLTVFEGNQTATYHIFHNAISKLKTNGRLLVNFSSKRTKRQNTERVLKKMRGIKIIKQQDFWEISRN